jgi:protein gp37
MGEATKIQWCHHSFNGWIGCSKVSEGCRNCYASDATPTRIARSKGLELWGVGAARKVTSDANWRLPLRWNRAAEKAGERRRVFCASLSDVFEDRRDLDEHRARLWELIRATPWLDWMLLTKRPEAMLRMWPTDAPRNAWSGVSVEDQKTADERIPHLLSVPAAVHFVSYEPALGKIDFTRICAGTSPHNALTGAHLFSGPYSKDWPTGIDLIIVGGESGFGARRFRLRWARDVVRQCRTAKVACFIKQIGAFPTQSREEDYAADGILLDDEGLEGRKQGRLRIVDKKGGDISEFPRDLRVREMPEVRYD